MLRKRKLSLILIAIVSSVYLNGCSKSSAKTNIETRNYTISIDGEKQYKDESEEEFIQCTEMVNNFINEYGTQDYKSDKLTNMYDYYSKSRRESIDVEAYKLKNKEQEKQYELQVSVDLIEIESAYFYKVNGVTSYTVTAQYISTLNNCNKEYLEAVGLSGNCKFSRNITLKCTLEDGNWKVSEISSISNREEIS